MRERGNEREGEGGGGGRRGRGRKETRKFRIPNTLLHFTINYDSSLSFSTPTPTHILLYIKFSPDVPPPTSPSSFLPPLHVPQTLPKSQPSHTRPGSASVAQRHAGRCWQGGRRWHGTDASGESLSQTSRPWGSSCNVLSIVSGHQMWDHLPHQTIHLYCV